MRVAHVGIGRPRESHRVGLVSYVGYAQCRLVGTEADLLSPVFAVGAAVDHALGVVGVPRVPAARGRIGEASGERWIGRILDVDHVEAAAACLSATAAAHRVGESGLDIDDDVVGAVYPVVVRGLLKDHGRITYVTQLGQVEHLHTVVPSSVGDDEGMILVHLDVAPHARPRTFGQRQLADVHGVERIADIDERGGVAQAH